VNSLSEVLSRLAPSRLAVITLFSPDTDHALFEPISTSGEASASPRLLSKSTVATVVAAAAQAVVNMAHVDPPPSTAMITSTYTYLLDSKDWGKNWVLCVNCLVTFEWANGFPEIISIFLHL